MKTLRIRRFVLVGLIFLTMWVPIIGLAQDYDTGLQDATQWTSPMVETTKDTRIEWEVHLYSASSEYTFVIKVIRDTGEVWDTKSGGVRNGDVVKSLGSIDFAMNCYLEVITNNVRVWTIKLFALGSIPTTTGITTTATTTTSASPTVTTSPPTTNPETITIAEATVTNTVTVINRDPVTTTVTIAETTYTRLVAAFTELPDGTRLVTPSVTSWLIGVFSAIVIALLIVLRIFYKKGGIIIYSEKDTGEDDSSGSK